jgi:hypothetical protein
LRHRPTERLALDMEGDRWMFEILEGHASAQNGAIEGWVRMVDPFHMDPLHQQSTARTFSLRVTAHNGMRRVLLSEAGLYLTPDVRVCEAVLAWIDQRYPTATRTLELKDLLVICPDANRENQVTRTCARDGKSGLEILLAEDDGLRDAEPEITEALEEDGVFTGGGGAEPQFMLIEVRR